MSDVIIGYRFERCQLSEDLYEIHTNWLDIENDEIVLYEKRIGDTYRLSDDSETLMKCFWVPEGKDEASLLHEVEWFIMRYNLLLSNDKELYVISDAPASEFLILNLCSCINEIELYFELKAFDMWA